MSASSPERQRQLDDALNAYRRACARGERPDIAELRTRYPELAELFDHVGPTQDRHPPTSEMDAPTVDREQLGRAPRDAHPTSDDECDAAEPDQIARISIPGYELLGEIARGGMGVVYKARQVGTNRLVAIKMLLAGAHSRPKQRRRFLDEAEAVARLAHPNIVQIFDAGEADGLPFFAMEFCAGGSVADLQRGEPMPPSLAAALLERVARAAHAMHENNLVHRDLKPANILLASADAATLPSHLELTSDNIVNRWIPKITDFGLAKNLEGDGATASKAVLGTPSYMAPEQAGGKSKHVGPTADVWSLGAILYDLLTGRPPFVGSTNVDTIAQVLFEEPTPLRQVRRGVPRDLELICLKCLEKESHNRYPTADALADDLRRFLGRQPVLVRPLGTLARVGRWCRRNPMEAVLTAALFLALLAGAIVASIFAVQATDKARDEAIARLNEEFQRQKAEEGEKQANQALRKANDKAYLSQLNLVVQALQSGSPDVALAALDGTQLDLRGWEYRFLSTLLRNEPASLAKLDKPDASLAWSADGRRFAYGTDDGTVAVWDVEIGIMQFSQEAFKTRVHALAFSSDGKHLGATDQEHSIKVWDLSNEQALAGGPTPISLAGHYGRVESIAFNADGTRLASGGADKKLIVWDLRTNKPALQVADMKFAVQSLAFNPDSTRLVSGGPFWSLIVWDVSSTREGSPRMVANHTPEKPNPLVHHAITAVVFDPDGKRIAWADKKGTVGIWDPANGQEILRPFVNPDITSLWFSSDGRVVSTFLHGALDIWDPDGDRQILYAPRVPPGGTRLRASIDGRHLASITKDNALRVWRTDIFFEAQVLAGHTEGHSDTVLAVATSSDGRHIVSGSLDHTVRVWDTLTGQRTGILRGHKDSVSSVAVSPDGSLIVSGSFDRSVKIWDRASGQLLQTLEGHPDNVAGIAFSPDGELLASVSSNELRLWKVNPRAEAPLTSFKTIKVAEEPLLCLAFHPKGNQIAVGTAGGKVRIWNLADATEDRVIQAHKSELMNLAYAPDGKLFSAAAKDPLIKEWDGKSDEPVRVLKGHKSGVTSVAVNTDGRTLASGSFDKTVKLWDLGQGSELKTFHEPNGFVYSIAFSSNGSRLVAGCETEAPMDEDAPPPDRRLLMWQVPAPR